MPFYWKKLRGNYSGSLKCTFIVHFTSACTNDNTTTTVIQWLSIFNRKQQCQHGKWGCGWNCVQICWHQRKRLCVQNSEKRCHYQTLSHCSAIFPCYLVGQLTISDLGQSYCLYSSLPHKLYNSIQKGQSDRYVITLQTLIVYLDVRTHGRKVERSAVFCFGQFTENRNCKNMAKAKEKLFTHMDKS